MFQTKYQLTKCNDLISIQFNEKIFEFHSVEDEAYVTIANTFVNSVKIVCFSIDIKNPFFSLLEEVIMAKINVFNELRILWSRNVL